jgi:hypothetical protein
VILKDGSADLILLRVTVVIIARHGQMGLGRSRDLSALITSFSRVSCSPMTKMVQSWNINVFTDVEASTCSATTQIAYPS